jgi:signal transduction histidine kinase
MIDPKLLTHITHEVRSPLSTIRGYISMLKEGAIGQLDDDAKDAVLKIHKDLIKTVYLLNDFAFLFKLEDLGKDYASNIETFSLKALMDDLIEEYKKEEEKGGKVNFVINISENINMKASKMLVFFAINFLLKHVVRGAKEGDNINIGVEILSDPTNPNGIKFSIKSSIEPLPSEIKETGKDIFSEPFVFTFGFSTEDIPELEQRSGLELFNCNEVLKLIPNSKVLFDDAAFYIIFPNN